MTLWKVRERLLQPQVNVYRSLKVFITPLSSQRSEIFSYYVEYNLKQLSKFQNPQDIY